MLHPDFERELGRERVAQLRREVDHDRLEARLTREDRLAKVISLSEEVSVNEAPVVRGGMVARGATYVAALFR